MKSIALLLLASLAISLTACSTGAKKDCCGTASACCAEGKGAHKHSH